MTKNMHTEVPRTLRLKPDGVFVLEAFSKEQLAYDTGGPKSLVMLLSMDEVCQELTVQEFIHAVEIERDVRKGRGHPVIASVVQLLARRP